MHRADRIVMAQTRHAVNHDGAGFDRAVERLDRLHDRRLRQSSREDRADKIEPRHRCYRVDGYDAVFDSLLAGFIVHDLSTQHVVMPTLIPGIYDCSRRIAGSSAAYGSRSTISVTKLATQGHERQTSKWP